MPIEKSRMELILRENYRLTTAEILYHMPDHYSLLQSYIWQEYDVAPTFPVLQKFLAFWERELEGKLHSVKIASCEIIKPHQFCYATGEFTIQ